MDAIWCVLLSNITRTTHAAEWRSTVDDDDAATASIHIRIAEPITRSIGTHSITHTHRDSMLCVGRHTIKTESMFVANKNRKTEKYNNFPNPTLIQNKTQTINLFYLRLE